MTGVSRSSGPPCGNNPNHRLSPGDQAAVAEFLAYLATRRTQEKTMTAHLTDEQLTVQARTETLAEVVAWLTKKASEYRSTRSRQHAVVADAITTLASKIHRGAVRPNNLLGADLTTLDPIQLRWGLNDVMWGDDDTVTVLMSGPDRAPYWLELDAERAAVLREDLAGPTA